MKIVIAIDSFKGSLSSIKANEAASEGIKRACPSAETHLFPIADGGEGTVDALVYSLKGERIKTIASNPLNKKIDCEYCIVNGKTAVIEIAAAAGLPLLEESERNPMFTSTYGVGELIRDAIKRAEAQLMEMEDRLGLVKRFKDMQTGLEEIIECATKISAENRNTGLSREINDLSVRIKSIALSLSE